MQDQAIGATSRSYLLPVEDTEFLLRDEMPAIRFALEYAKAELALSLTLADLGGVCERVLHAMPDMLRNFDAVSAWPRHERNLMRPYFAAYCGNGVAEGRDGFWIPRGGSDLKFARL